MGHANDAVLDVTYDPCDALIVTAVGDVRAAELDGIDDALAMWNDAASTVLTRDDVPAAPEVTVRFENAAPMFHGVYDDETGEIYINRDLSDPHERAVTVAHELGHAFGLLHVSPDERPSVMNNGNLVLEPNADDVRALYALWGDCPSP